MNYITHSENDLEIETYLEKLSSLGFKREFFINKDSMIYAEGNELFSPSDIKVENVYRIKRKEDPNDEQVIYALSTSSGLKGILQDSYGIIENEQIKAFIDNVTD